MSDYVLFAVAPAVAVFVFLVVALSRLRPGHVTSSVCHARRRSSRLAILARAPIALAWLLLIAGHLALVVWPEAVLSWNRATPRRIGLEVALPACGLAILADLLWSLVRRLRRLTEAAPAGAPAFEATLIVAVVSGLGVAVLYRWASMWSAVTLTPFVRSLVRLQPDVEWMATMPYLVKLHVFSGIAVVALWPLTRWGGTGLQWVVRWGWAAFDGWTRRYRPAGARARECDRGPMWPDDEGRD